MFVDVPEDCRQRVEEFARGSFDLRQYPQELLLFIEVIPRAADQRDVKLVLVNIWAVPDHRLGLKSLRFESTQEQIVLFE